MTRFTIGSFCFLLSCLLPACSKQGSFTRETIYLGTTHAHFEQVWQDSLSGGWMTSEWDSTYVDQVRVSIDYQSEQIRFDLSSQHHLCPNLQDSYTFPIEQALYMKTFSAETYESFFLEEGYLNRNLFSQQGSGPAYTKRILNFHGLR